jgi:VWFA-related protein
MSLSVLSGLSQDKSAEQPSAKENSPFKLSVSSNIVLVPVVVSDKHGQHVAGLKAEDFEIREEGQAQKISAFEEVTADAAAIPHATVAPNSFTNQVTALRPKKLEIILLDLLNTPLSGRAEARRGLTEFLSKSADQDTLVALLVLGSSGVRIIHNFTSDSAVLVRAIRKVQAPASSRDAPALQTDGGDVDAEARQLGFILDGEATLAATHIGNAHIDRGVAAALARLRADEATSDANYQDQAALTTLVGMQQVARYFAAVPGRKSLFWASTGFRFSTGGLAREGLRGAAPDDWQRTMRMLQDANIAVYPVDLGGVGLQDEGDITAHGEIPRNGGLDMLAAGKSPDITSAKHLTMDTLASMTGGRAYYNGNYTDEFFRHARQDSAAYYMLAYYAKDTGKNGWRKLSVRVHHDGASSVRARSGFYFNNAGPDPEATRQKDEFLALTSALESTSLPINGQWKQVETAGDQRKVHFALLVPPGVVQVDTEHENHVNLDFLVLAWNTEGKEVAKIGQRLDSKLTTTDVSQIKTHGMDYDNALTLPPGEYDIHFVVRDNLQGRLGSVATHLKVE